MKRNRKRSRTPKGTIHAYTYAQAMRVLPYLTSIMRSLRYWRLEALVHSRRAQQLANRPGRADRSALLEMEEANRAARAAEARFDEALEDLHTLDIYCLDPVRGEALVPFVHANQLAWLVFDLFDALPFRSWRYHTDSLDTRRPLAEAGLPGHTNFLVV